MMWTLVGGFFVHVVLLVSIFDIYFQSPIVHGITPHSNPEPGAAKRLVFFIADGLRSDSFFPHDKNSTPYLRKVIEEHGSWGVSHTRVPTESRPGVVALTAGIYEDPSAVFKGWKENPVEFDSLFNQSRHTWAWGSPDIVSMFARDHVRTHSYKQEDEDFSGRDSSWRLDQWVFDHVHEFFSSSKSDQKRHSLLHEDKIVFFLHLLGLDTAGHTIKPHAREYQENLRVVDKGIEQMVDLVEAFFDQDGKTAYVFTADHGMTDWGSHGAGSKDETEVPIVAWGAGIKGPQASDPSDPPSPRHWRLSHLKRRDVDQADIVTLLASLIGCSIPVNSIGRIPRGYLNLPSEQIAKLSLYNAQQLLAQADRKRELVQSGALTWLYKPFPKLMPDDEASRIQLISSFIKSKDFSSAIQISEELAVLSIEALNYYHNYYQNLLLTSVSLLFLGWIAWLLSLIAFKYKDGRSVISKTSGGLTKVFVSAAILVLLLIQVQDLPWQYNVYCLLPLLLWWAVFHNAQFWQCVKRASNGPQNVYRFIIITVVLIIFTQVMVFAFFERWVLSVGMLGCALWPLLSSDQMKRIPPHLLYGWLVSCAAVAIFPLLPVIGKDNNLLLVIVSGFLWIGSAAVAIFYIDGGFSSKYYMIFSQMFLILCVVFNVTSVAVSVQVGEGLPLICQIVSWIVLGFSPLVPLYEEQSLLLRLLSVCLALLAPYLLLSVRHEALFILSLSIHLLYWLFLEAYIAGFTLTELKRMQFNKLTFKDMSTRALSSHDFRRAALFVFYIFLSFFGTGNIASLNSFEVTWVRCFVSVFSPFTMTALILLKMIVPFIIVSSMFRAVNITVQATTSHMFLSALIVCDLMGLHFLHLVTNEGSWLDIGISISHYVIVQVTVLALVLLYGLASVLTGFKMSLKTQHVGLDDNSTLMKNTPSKKFSEPFPKSISQRKSAKAVLPT